MTKELARGLADNQLRRSIYHRRLDPDSEMVFRGLAQNPDIIIAGKGMCSTGFDVGLSEAEPVGVALHRGRRAHG